MNPLVSIVVPMFNRGEVIKETIESVLIQGYSNWEMILVDDGSTDQTISIVKEFVAIDERIKLFERTRLPKGAPTCRNIGLEVAKGEWLIFLDSDDVIAPNCLEERVKKIQHHHDVDFIVNNSAFFTNHPTDSTHVWNRMNDDSAINRFLVGEAVWQTTGPTWSVNYLKRTQLRFDEKLLSAQDWDLHLRALLMNPKFNYINAAPDNFIRRNKKVTTISSQHRNTEKTLNRLQMFERLMDLPAIQENQSYFERLLFAWSIEINRFIQLGNNIDEEMYNSFLHHTQRTLSKALKSIVRFVKHSYYLKLKSQFLYKTYRKLFFNCSVNEKLYGESLYRSAITDKEKHDIENMYSK